MTAAPLVRDVGRGTGPGVTITACGLGFLGFVGLVLGNGLGLVFALWYWAAWTLYIGFNRKLATRAFSTIVPWIFPAWALLSMVWSRDPSSSARVAIQLAVTTGISIIIPQALTARGMLACLFLALLTGSIIGLATGGSEVIYTGNVEALHGIFGSKNNFAMFAALLMLTGIGIAIDRKSAAVLRLIAIGGMALAAYELFQTHSTGANVATALAIMILMSLRVLQWVPMPMRMMVVLVALAVLLVLVAVGFAFLDATSVDSLLKAVGKNPTLTGRSYLWARAQDTIESHRWLGIGFQAYWRQGQLDAEGLWRYLMIEARAGVSMHNLYYEAMIEVGLVGFILLMTQLALTVLGAFVASILRWDAFIGVGVAVCLFFATRLFLETEFLSPFGMATVLFVMIWTHARMSLVRYRNAAAPE